MKITFYFVILYQRFDLTAFEKTKEMHENIEVNARKYKYVRATFGLRTLTKLI